MNNEEAANANMLISDIRLAKILKENQNYNERLYEAYLRLKEMGIKSKKEFISRRQETGIGQFLYEEITFYDRIEDVQYKNIVFGGWDKIHDLTEAFINAKDLGDRLAEYGTLGKVKTIDKK